MGGEDKRLLKVEKVEIGVGIGIGVEIASDVSNI